jgi:hypothetical protein
MDEAEDVVECRRVFGLALETYELGVDDIEALCCLGEEFAEKIIHDGFPQHA